MFWLKNKINNYPQQAVTMHEKNKIKKNKRIYVRFSTRLALEILSNQKLNQKLKKSNRKFQVFKYFYSLI